MVVMVVVVVMMMMKAMTISTVKPLGLSFIVALPISASLLLLNASTS